MPATRTLPSRREMERALLARDRSYDGVFVLGVKTTKIFCRPGCPARMPRPENVEYFAGAREALLAGYRACKRCRPLETAGAHPAWAQRLLALADERSGARVRDGELAALGIEPARARRYFKSRLGMTFQAYCRARRLGEAFTAIRTGADMNDTAYGTGYESVSGFRDAFARVFDAAPGQSRRTADCVRLAWLESPLGPLVLGASDEGACLVEFSDRRALEAQLATLRRRFARPLVPGRHAHLERLAEELRRYFAGELRRFEVPLAYPGTPFERRVWDALLTIPFGETCSYAALAREIGRPGAARAVGSANGRNRLGIVIPCHRVVNAGGKLGGYGGGLWRKEWLLAHERAAR